jgi:hypothetical protein
MIDIDSTAATQSYKIIPGCFSFKVRVSKENKWWPVCNIGVEFRVLVVEKQFRAKNILWFSQIDAVF